LYQLIIRLEAEQDIDDAYDWYEANQPRLGSEFVRAVDVAITKIGRNPLAYPVKYRQVRRVLLKRFPYCLFYVLMDDTIFVLACFHGKLDPKRWQERFGN
jgi:plasmid stabilization system protein ParE